MTSAAPHADGFVARLPRPLALLWRRLDGDMSDRERHQRTVALGLAALRLASALRVALWVERGFAPGSPTALRLEGLTSPTPALWCELLGSVGEVLTTLPGLGAIPVVSTHPHLVAPPQPEPAIEAFVEAVQTGGLTAPLSRRARTGSLRLFEVLVRHRDAAFGRGEAQDAADHARFARLLRDALAAIFTRGALFEGMVLGQAVDGDGWQPWVGLNDATAAPLPGRRSAVAEGAPIFVGSDVVVPLSPLAAIHDGALGLLDRRVRRQRSEGGLHRIAEVTYVDPVTERTLPLDAMAPIAELLLRLRGEDRTDRTLKAALAATQVTLDSTPQAQEGPVSGELIDARYRIERVLGEGAMGIVYEAEHVDLGRPVALKLLHPNLSQSEAFVERFRREARQAAAAQHPGIVDVLDYGRDETGRSYLAMELLEGIPLDALVARGPLPVAEAVDLVVHTLDALAAAHDQGLVHRDLKPQNLFVCDRETRVKILDFGIAKLIREDQRLTATGHVLGTPAYMSLEQMRDPTQVDARTDVYAMGVTLFELLTGHLPLTGASMVALITAMVEDQVQRSPRALRPDVPPWLDAVVARALAKNADDRYPDARAFQRALLADAANMSAPPPGPSAHPKGPGDSAPPPGSYHGAHGWVAGESASPAGASSGPIVITPPADDEPFPATEPAPRVRGGGGKLAALAAVLVVGGGAAGAWTLTREAPEAKHLDALELPEAPSAAPSASARPWYSSGDLKLLPDSCGRGKVLLATSPAPDGERWTWSKQALTAHPELEVAAGTAVLPGKIALAEHRKGNVHALVATCDVPTCNRLAAMYRAVVPKAHLQLYCGRVPGLPAGARPVTLVSRSAHDLPAPRSVLGRCARLTICLTKTHPERRDTIGFACQRSPSAFPLKCARKPTCEAVAECAREAEEQ